MEITGPHLIFSVNYEHVDSVDAEGTVHRTATGERLITLHLAPGADARVIALFDACEDAVRKLFAAHYGRKEKN